MDRIKEIIYLKMKNDVHGIALQMLCEGSKPTSERITEILKEIKGKYKKEFSHSEDLVHDIENFEYNFL